MAMDTKDGTLKEEHHPNPLGPGGSDSIATNATEKGPQSGGSISSEQIEAYIGKLASSFPFFLEQLWLAVGLPSPAEHQSQIGDWLQDGPKRRGVRAFRGASKTWVTLAFCLWRLFKNDNERVLLVSKSERHSKDSLHMARKWIGQVPFLQHMVPDRTAGQRDSALQFDIRQAPPDRTPSFTAASITGQITGSRASLLIADDVETNQTTLTLEMRTRLREEVKEFDNILIPGGDIVILGTPHHEESLLDKLSESGYRFQSWPAMLPRDQEDIPDLAVPLQERLDSGKGSPGDPVWPDRFDLEELAAREASEGRSTFAMQYQMITSLGDTLRYPLRLSDCIVFPVQRDKAPITIAWGQHNDRGGTTRLEDINSLGFGTDGFYAPIMYDTSWDKYSGTFMWVDPSGKGADKTAYAIVSHINGYLYVHEVKGLEGGYGPQVLDTICFRARENRVGKIVVESQFGAGMFASLLEPSLQRHFVEPNEIMECPEGWACHLEEQRVSGQKELRIIGVLEPLLNSHRLVLKPEVAFNEDLQYQLTRVTRQKNSLKHDDELDALASCCGLWLDDMNMDPDAAADRKREQLMDEELRKHYASFGFTNNGPPGWIKRRGDIRYGR